MSLPPRNQPCPCGSGKKFKKCCGANAPVDTGQNSRKPASHTKADALKRMSERNWNEAISLFKSILDQTDEPHYILQAIASCYDGLDEFLHAAEYYEKALALAPQDLQGTLWHQLGVARACAGRIDKAEEAFEHAMEREDHPARRQHISAVITMLRRIRDGQENPHSFLLRVQLERAFTDMEEERYESAAARLQGLLPLDPDNPVLLYNLGVVRTFLKEEDSALQAFERTVKINPAYAEAWYNIGQIALLKQRDYSKALHCFEKASQARPDYIGAHHQSGVAWELLGDKDKAVACWTKTLELDPNNRQAQQNIDRVRSAKTS